MVGVDEVSEMQSSPKGDWSMDELRVLTAIFFNSDFSIGDDEHDECRIIADCFGRTPSSIDRQWRNLSAVLNSKKYYNIGRLVRQAVADYLDNPVAHRGIAIDVCRSRGWALESMITGVLPTKPLVADDIRNHAELMSRLLDFCEQIDYQVFKTGSHGFAKRGEVELSDRRRYQVQITAILVGCGDDGDVESAAKASDVSEAIAALLPRVRTYEFGTGRIGVYGKANCIVGNEHFQIVIQAIQIGGGVMSERQINITPSPRLLQVLGDIPLQPWQCLAELVDNSLDELLKLPDRNVDNPLEVSISMEKEADGKTYLIVSDNGLGMGPEELERALQAGRSAKNRYGSLGIFGMGFNIATARLGNVTTVTTTKAGMPEALEATIDFADLQKRESFVIPLHARPTDPATEGTTVKVLLKRDMAELFGRLSMQKTLIYQLGDVYSYLLRDSIPGISRAECSSLIPARIKINDVAIEPRLPCVWSDSRSVVSYGQQVNAIQYINVRLTEATACLDCGYWDKKNGPTECEECGSTNLELRERRIWGWLGIQRYIDSNHYGIDFIRYGRKILKGDKTVFSYQDPDTLQVDAEYPIEMPANQGRIIGEIHLDHVPVTYQKNDFDRQSRDWQVAIETIRGTGPLKPRGAREPNDSPLARLYSAYRRNDPGLRYLVPGDGKTALHTKSRDWARLFEKGVTRYQTDEIWFDAAMLHQKIKDKESDEPSRPPVSIPGSTGAIDTLIGSKEPIKAPVKHEPALTHQQVIERAKMNGSHREDLSSVYKLGSKLGNWTVSVVTTRETLRDEKGEVVPALHGSFKGNEIEVLVSSEHPVFKDYGRDVRDVAIMYGAGMIKELAKSDSSVASIYALMVQEIQDLRMSAPILLERIDRSLDRMRRLCLQVISSDPESFWKILKSTDKQIVEEAGALKLPMTPFEELIADGRFVTFSSADALADLITSRPLAFFDGVVFKPSLNHRTAGAQERIIGKVVRTIRSLSDFMQDDLLRQKYDLHLVQISLDLLDEMLVSEDLIS